VGRRLRAAVLLSSGRRVVIVGATGRASAADLLIRVESGASTPHAAGAAGIEPRDLFRDALTGSAAPAPRIMTLDGADARALARVSREDDVRWFDELAYGAAVRGAELMVFEDARADVPQGVMQRAGRFVRLALRREEYADAPAR